MAGVGVGLAGCGLFGGPGGTDIGTIEPGGSGSDERSVDLGGTVVLLTPIGAIIDDGTGLARVVPEGNYVLDQEAVGIGDCLSVTGRINGRQSDIHEMLYVNFREGEKAGGCGDREKLPEPPTVLFDPELDPETDTGAIVKDNDAEVLAGKVILRKRPEDSERRWADSHIGTWADNSDLAPEDPIPEGSRIEFDETGVKISPLWDSDIEGFYEPLQEVGF